MDCTSQGSTTLGLPRDTDVSLQNSPRHLENVIPKLSRMPEEPKLFVGLISMVRNTISTGTPSAGWCWEEPQIPSGISCKPRGYLPSSGPLHPCSKASRMFLPLLGAGGCLGPGLCSSSSLPGLSRVIAWWEVGSGLGAMNERERGNRR